MKTYDLTKTTNNLIDVICDVCQKSCRTLIGKDIDGVDIHDHEFLDLKTHWGIF